MDDGLDRIEGPDGSKITESEFIRLAIDRFNDAHAADYKNREDALDDLEFIAGNQWPASVKQDRESKRRPVITVNRLTQFTRQVTGDIRRMNPAIKVLPADGFADREKAKLRNGIIRHIEHQSSASVIYERAAESAANCGIGWFRVVTDYRAGDTFDQEIYIEQIFNPFAVVVDPDARDPTRKDAKYMFLTERISYDRFKTDYPDAKAISWEGEGRTENLRHWFTSDAVMIAEYFYIKKRERELGFTDQGAVVDLTAQPELADLSNIVERRKQMVDVVVWQKMSGHEILEGPTEWIGQYIPIVCVCGEELHVGERVIRTSVIRHAKGPQILYNFERSAMAEMYSQQPKAPFMVTPLMIEGHEEEWSRLNKDSPAYLEYNPDPDVPGGPQRLAPPAASGALITELQVSQDDMNATTGIYPAALGERSNETSGIAIRQRQMESDTSTSIYAANMSAAIEHCGRIILDLIPKVYDTDRYVRIIGEDERDSVVRINRAIYVNGQEFIENDISEGSYDVRITTGPSYATAQQETAESLTSFATAFPAAAPALIDLAAKTQQWPEADKLSERLARLVPDNMLTAEELETRQRERQEGKFPEQPPPPEALEMQLRQQQQQQEMAIKLEELELERQKIQLQYGGGSSEPNQTDEQERLVELRRKVLEVKKAEIELDQMNQQGDLAVAEAMSRIGAPGLTPEQAEAEMRAFMEALAQMQQAHQAQMAQQQALMLELIAVVSDQKSKPQAIRVKRNDDGSMTAVKSPVDGAIEGES